MIGNLKGGIEIMEKTIKFADLSGWLKLAIITAYVSLGAYIYILIDMIANPGLY